MEIKQNFNEEYLPLYNAGPDIRYYFLIGGRSAGRSKAVAQFIVSRLTDEEYTRCAMMRYTLEDVRNSIYQEVVDVIDEQSPETGIRGIAVRQSDMTLTYGQNKAKGMGFKASSGNNKSKMKSLAGFNIIAMEEADEVDEDSFMKLDDSVRTKKGRIMIIFMLNAPSKNHWIIKRFFNLIASGVEGFYKYELKPSIKNAVLMNTDFLHNIKNISRSTLENFKAYKTTNPDYYYNMIKGYVSEGARGRIFTNWTRCSAKEFEDLPYPVFYGMDFGFTNHPTALVELKMHNKKLWVRELIYQTGMDNHDICERMRQLGISEDDPIYPDSAEPKSIKEIEKEGFNVIASIKGQDSIRAGIDLLKTFEVVYTDDSSNVDMEVQEYKWALDKNKEPTNTPIDDFNHAIDAIRYGLYTHLDAPEPNIR